MTLIKEDAIQKKLTMNANNKRYYSEEYIKGWEDGVRDQYNETLSAEPQGELISREDAKEAVACELHYKLGIDIDMAKGVANVIDALPSTNDNWIPVSEKLPDEDDYNEYLVIDDRGYMAVGNYRHDAKAWDSGNFGWLEIRDKADEFPWGIGKVIAWYKPQPYKGGDDE